MSAAEEVRFFRVTPSIRVDSFCALQVYALIYYILIYIFNFKPNSFMSYFRN